MHGEQLDDSDWAALEKNSFWNIFGYKWNDLNPFQGFKKEIPCSVVTLEFRASTG